LTSGHVYKIITADAWRDARNDGVLALAGVDARDGFVHLSGADQVAATLALHFADAHDLTLVAFDAAALGDGLRWEASRDGALFPHFYGPLAASLATGAWPLTRGADGVFVLPDALA